MIGLCCHYLVEKNNSTENLLNEKKLQFNAFKNNKYSNDHILNIYKNNIFNLKNLIVRIYNEGFRSYRMSSGLLPLFDVVSENIINDDCVLSSLKDIGDFVLKNNIRITCHPDQFVVLSSDSQNVINNSVNILKYHAWIFDKMNLPLSPYYSINIHGGKRGNSKILINTINSLPENVKYRLTLENDESSYSVANLLEVNKDTNIPICFDSHHHSFNEGNLKDEDAFIKAINTWGNIKPLTHLSNTTPEFKNSTFANKRKHSNYVHYIPEYQRISNNENIIDIDFEFKLKNLAIYKAISDFDLKLNIL